MTTAPDILPTPDRLGEVTRFGAERWPERVAVLDRERQVTYAELHRRTRQLARALGRRGIRAGDRVALFLPNSVGFLETYFALAHLGAVTVPIGTRHSAREVSFLIAQSGSRAVLHTPELGEKLGETAPEVDRITWAEAEAMLAAEDAGPGAVELPEPGPEANAAIFYTSGTTGDPKGVLLTHRNISHCLTVVAEAFAYDESDVALCQLPLSHTNVNFLPLPILYTGGVVVLEEKFEPPASIELIARHGVTVYVSVTATAMLLVKHAQAEHEGLTLPSVRKLLTGGSPVPQSLRRDLFTLMPNATMANCYGMTETASGISRMDPDFMAAKDGSVGLRYRGLEVRIQPGEGGPDEPGEVEIRSPSVMVGYWDNPEATAEVLQDGWLKTGDMGRIDEDGYLWLSGRRKHRIKRGGETLFPAEIESVVSDYPGVKEVAVVPADDEVMGDRVVALVAMQPGHELDPDQLIEHCRAHLAEYKVPEYLADLSPELPKNKVGKIDAAGLERAVGSGEITTLDYRRGTIAKRGQQP